MSSLAVSGLPNAGSAAALSSTPSVDLGRSPLCEKYVAPGSSAGDRPRSIRCTARIWPRVSARPGLTPVVTPEELFGDYALFLVVTRIRGVEQRTESIATRVCAALFARRQQSHRRKWASNDGYLPTASGQNGGPRLSWGSRPAGERGAGSPVSRGIPTEVPLLSASRPRRVVPARKYGSADSPHREQRAAATYRG